MTFDSKVKMADGAVATLGNKTLTPTVSGKTITFSYMGLDYNTTYTFTLPANSVSNLFDNEVKEDITIRFTTIAPPAVTPGMYDAIVSNADELLEALAQGNAASTSVHVSASSCMTGFRLGKQMPDGRKIEHITDW